MYNGIKVDGVLHKAYIRIHENIVYVTAKHYERFPKEVQEMFSVENRTDTQSDYFDHDHFQIPPCHKKYDEAFQAVKKREEKESKYSVKP